MFERFRKKQVKTFDRARKTPVIRASICTGERVAGFRDRETGRFEEVLCLRTDGDLREFLETYGVDESEIQKEW